MIAAIYETVIRPGLYDSFMEAWEQHIRYELGRLEETISASGDTLPADAPELDIDPGLQAHFARAYEILEQFGRKMPPPDMVEAVRGAEGFAILLDAAGRCIAVSARTRDTLPDKPCHEAVADILVAGSRDLLDQMLAAVQAGKSDTPPVVLATGVLPRHLMARVVKAPAQTGGNGLALAIEALEYRWSKRAEAMLIASFSLSRAEVDIVRHLLAGLSLRDIAAHTGRSEHTVRNQSKAVLAKTGAPGQVDLIRLVVFLINQDTRNRSRRAAAPSMTRTMMRMSSGKAMQLYDMGPRDGVPVIFLHGMLEGPAALEHHHDRLVSEGFRVLMPARPGYGQSEPAHRPRGTIDLLQSHVVELIETRGLKRPVLLGNLGGALFAHVLACRLHDHVAGAVTCSGPAPITRISQFAQMAPRQRVVAYTARFAPALLPTVLRAGIAQIDGNEIDEFMAALFKPGTHEYAMIERLGVAATMQAGFRFSVEQGPSGFATDSHFIVRDWRHEIRGASPRVINLKGEMDTIAPASIMAEAMRDLPNVEVRVVKDAGQLLIYEAPDVVIDALREVSGAD
ncbi:alpha/beta fold hydrolase [Arenibacterium halophilum]|uniref:Alpha/beta fold hydrolase n=1 Tax=Arenibacterium halophilum TaxID=2583821 RepID=A0ABY2XAG5_9RHOB|nr:alpha/beta fold hydrolase [Arenibacterium halophilum]TMV12978.1 alpha/beta fold hydrolase [Arenibacterium halophilum]